MAKRKSPSKKKREPKPVFNPFTNTEPGTPNEPNLFQVDMSKPQPAVAQDFDADGPISSPRLVDLRDGYAPPMTEREMKAVRMANLPFLPLERRCFGDFARRDPVASFFYYGPTAAR